MIFRFTLPLILLAALAPAQIRVGIVGTDTSHAPAFTSMLNDLNHKEHVPGARVVAAYKGGSKDLASWDRVDKHAAEPQAKWGVEIVPDIPTLLTKVDAVCRQGTADSSRPSSARSSGAMKPVHRQAFGDRPSPTPAKRAFARENNVAGFHFAALWSEHGRRKRPDMTGAITRGLALRAIASSDLSWYKHSRR